MVSSAVRFDRFEVFGPQWLGARRVGVVEGVVRAPTVDRLSWTRDPRSVPRPAPGVVDVRPVAVGRSSVLCVASDSAGFACFVRRATAEAAPVLAAGYRTGSALVGGVDVPDVLGVAGGDVWIDHLPWASRQTRAGDGEVDGYVTSLLAGLFDAGVLIGTGEVRVGRAGSLVCEDVVVAARLEHDQRSMLCQIVVALAERDPVRVADAVAELCHLRPPRLSRTAGAVVRSLEARWDAVAFGLAVHGLGRAVLGAGMRCEPLVLLGDELLHRLDLAHRHHVSVRGLSTPGHVIDLASSRGPA